MIRSTENQREKGARPFCQATSCFHHANAYIALEKEEAGYYKVIRDSNYGKVEKGFNTEFDGLEIILYLCSRHDGEFKYLIRWERVEDLEAMRSPHSRNSIGSSSRQLSNA